MSDYAEFQDVFLFFVISISSPCTFAIKISKQTEQEGRKLVETLDQRTIYLRDLAERVEFLMNLYGPEFVHFFEEEFNQFASSLSDLFGTMTSCRTYIIHLKQIIDDDPRQKMTQALKKASVPTGTPGKSIATGRLEVARECSLDACSPSFSADACANFIAVIRDPEDRKTIELTKKIKDSWDDFCEKGLAYAGFKQ